MQIGKYQSVGAAFDQTCGRFRLRDLRNERRIGLKLSVNHELRIPGFHRCHSLANAVN